MHTAAASRAALTAFLLALAACGGPQEGGSPPVPSSPPASPGPGSPPAPPGAGSPSAASAPPVITALDVHGAPPAGGTTVIIDGTGFQPGLAVAFGGAAATAVAVASAGSIACTTPALPAGVYDVVVTNPDGQSSTFSGFHYEAPPTVTSFFPGSGAPGAAITVLGTDFVPGMVGGAAVTFGSTAATIVSSTLLGRAVGSPIEDVVTLPNLAAGSYQVTVTNPDGQRSVAPGLFVVTGP